MVGDRRRTGGDLDRVRGLDELSFEMLEHPLMQGPAPLRLDGCVRRLLPRAVGERRLVPDPVHVDPGVELRRQGVDRLGLAGEDLGDQGQVEPRAFGEDGSGTERTAGGGGTRFDPPAKGRHDRRSASAVWLRAIVIGHVEQGEGDAAGAAIEALDLALLHRRPRMLDRNRPAVGRSNGSSTVRAGAADSASAKQPSGRRLATTPTRPSESRLSRVITSSSSGVARWMLSSTRRTG